MARSKIFIKHSDGLVKRKSSAFFRVLKKKKYIYIYIYIYIYRERERERKREHHCLIALIVKDFPCYAKSKSESIIIYDVYLA